MPFYCNIKLLGLVLCVVIISFSLCLLRVCVCIRVHRHRAWCIQSCVVSAGCQRLMRMSVCAWAHACAYYVQLRLDMRNHGEERQIFSLLLQRNGAAKRFWRESVACLMCFLVNLSAQCCVSNGSWRIRANAKLVDINRSLNQWCGAWKLRIRPLTDAISPNTILIYHKHIMQ